MVMAMVGLVSIWVLSVARALSAGVTRALVAFAGAAAAAGVAAGNGRMAFFATVSSGFLPLATLSSGFLLLATISISTGLGEFALYSGITEGELS
jgi:hypothetical protein